MKTFEQIIEEMKQNAQTTHSSEPEYRCPECHDTGWVWIGKNTVRECSCVKARRAERIMRESGLADALDAQTFDKFTANTPVQKRMKEISRKYVEAVKTAQNCKPWLFIGGNPGSGKTHICTAVCGELLKAGIDVKYMQWLDECRRLKTYINEPDFDELVEGYIRVSVLYIDDLLKQRYTENPAFSDADIKVAFTILNARYLQDKPTIISSEWGLLEHLLPADEGVFSRVYERAKGFTISIDRNPENNYRLTRGA